METSVHYRIHNIPPNVLILSHMNLVQIPPYYLTKIILILSSHLRLGFPWALPIKTLYASLPFPLRATCTAYIIPLHLIIPIVFGEYNHEVPRYVVFSTSLLPRPSQAQNIFHSTTCSNTLSLYFSLNVHPHKTTDRQNYKLKIKN